MQVIGTVREALEAWSPGWFELRESDSGFIGLGLWRLWDYRVQGLGF